MTWEITLGEALQILSFVITILGAVVWLNGRITRLETRMEVLWNGYRNPGDVSPNQSLTSKSKP